jgi:hypothetical protein
MPILQFSCNFVVIYASKVSLFPNVKSLVAAVKRCPPPYFTSVLLYLSGSPGTLITAL